jgi:hypothetical protein
LRQNGLKKQQRRRVIEPFNAAAFYILFVENQIFIKKMNRLKTTIAGF